MFAIIHLLATFIADLFKSPRRLEVENLFLRHQLNVALRRAPQRVRLRAGDRALMVWMTRRWPSLLGLSRIVQPDTILRWHRCGFRAYWRWKSRGRPGRPGVSRELRELIQRMSKENPLWGAPRIHGELLKLGFEIAESTVSKYMIRRRGPPSQTWRTFLRNHAHAIAAIDLCVVPALTFERLPMSAIRQRVIRSATAVDASVMEADASRYHGKAPGEIDWSAPERQTRAVAEFLTAVDDEDADADRKPPKVVSPVDPCSAWTAKANKRVQFGYGLNYLIDIKYAVIVDVEATPARTYDEVAATKTMIQRTQERLGLKPDWLAADTAYGTGKFLHWVIGAGITPHIPVWDMSKREEGILSRADFTFDRERNLYICPQGKFLRTTGTVHDGRTIIYRASTRDCGPCPLKPKCTPNVTFRKIPRDVHEDARDATRALMGTPEFAKSRNERKKVEMRFAHLKTHHGFERMRLRGLSGARDEFHLAAIVQNLKTLALRLIRPPPKPAYA